jgi:hypothetical protein
MSCIRKQASKAVRRVLLGKQLTAQQYHQEFAWIVWLVKLARVVCIVKIVTLDIIKVNQVFHLVLNVFQVNTKMYKAEHHAKIVV